MSACCSRYWSRPAAERHAPRCEGPSGGRAAGYLEQDPPGGAGSKGARRARGCVGGPESQHHAHAWNSHLTGVVHVDLDRGWSADHLGHRVLRQLHVVGEQGDAEHRRAHDEIAPSDDTRSGAVAWSRPGDHAHLVHACGRCERDGPSCKEHERPHDRPAKRDRSLSSWGRSVPARWPTRQRIPAGRRHRSRACRPPKLHRAPPRQVGLQVGRHLVRRRIGHAESLPLSAALVHELAHPVTPARSAPSTPSSASRRARQSSIPSRRARLPRVDAW